MTTILLTGFEPFGGDRTNPSGAAVRLVEADWEGPETLIVAVLPVTFAGAGAELSRLIDEHSPDIVIATGLAGNRAAVSVERVAVNLIDARIPDNDGAQPIDAPSVDDGPAAYFATIPVKAIARDIAEAGIPSEVSHSAGTFVCNHASYVALHAAAARPGLRAGFLHVPWSVEDQPTPDAATLPLADITRAIAIAVRTSIRLETDAAVSAGAVS